MVNVLTVWRVIGKVKKKGNGHEKRHVTTCQGHNDVL